MITEKPGFHIIYGIDNVMHTQLELISNARRRLEICVENTQPNLAIESRQMRQRFLDNKAKGIKIRYLTEITKDNLYYCKELLSMVDELRHLDSIRGNFYVSEKEYAAPTVSHKKGKPTDMMIYSGNKEVVQHQQHIFESMWNASTSAERKIWEIERNVNLGITEIIDNPSKTQILFIDLIKSAKFEILLICPTVNAFLREYKIGAIKLFKEISAGAGPEIDNIENIGKSEEKGKGNRVNIKILTPTNDLVNRIIDDCELTTFIYNKIGPSLRPYSNLTVRNPSDFPSHIPLNQGIDHTLQIRYTRSLSKYNITSATIMVIDRRASLAIEKVDDTKEEFNEAVGLSTYSTSTPTIASYVSIFENLWNQVELYEKLSASERMEREFINMAAHELRTPAQAILGYTELALMEQEEEDCKDTVDNEKASYIAAAHRNAKRLQRLTKDILDVARIESNTLKLNRERLDLVENINEAISDIVHSQAANTKTTRSNPEIVFNKPGTALFINADRMRLNEVVANLLNNAINATKNNGKIIVSTKVVKCEKDDVCANYNNNNDNKDDDDNNNQNKMCIVVSIRDNGTGIDSEMESRLFTKFATKSESGLGLGLYISKNIIEAHGGRIWGENNKDEIGATFAFILNI
jgi:signal transduction histidine kinase